MVRAGKKLARYCTKQNSAQGYAHQGDHGWTHCCAGGGYIAHGPTTRHALDDSTLALGVVVTARAVRALAISFDARLALDLAGRGETLDLSGSARRRCQIHKRSPGTNALTSDRKMRLCVCVEKRALRAPIQHRHRSRTWTRLVRLRIRSVDGTGRSCPGALRVRNYKYPSQESVR
jgi:hypothetical protein